MCKEVEKLSISEIKAVQELIAGTNNLAELKVSLAITLGRHWPEVEELALICGLEPKGAAGAGNLARERGLLSWFMPAPGETEGAFTISEVFELKKAMPEIDTLAELKVGLACALTGTWLGEEDLLLATGLSRKSMLAGRREVRSRGLVARFLPEPPEDWGRERGTACSLLRDITAEASRLDKSSRVDLADYLEQAPEVNLGCRMTPAEQVKLLTELDILGEVAQALMILEPATGSGCRTYFGPLPGFVHRHVLQTRYAVERRAVKHDLAGFLVRSIAFDWPPPPDFDHWTMMEGDGWTEDQVYIATHDYTIQVPELWDCDYFTQWWGNVVHLFSPVED